MMEMHSLLAQDLNKNYDIKILSDKITWLQKIVCVKPILINLCEKTGLFKVLSYQ